VRIFNKAKLKCCESLIRLILEISYVKADHIARRLHWFLKNAAIDGSVLHAYAGRYIHVGIPFEHTGISIQTCWNFNCSAPEKVLIFPFYIVGIYIQMRWDFHPEAREQPSGIKRSFR
jgi:hypothetical protein